MNKLIRVDKMRLDCTGIESFTIERTQSSIKMATQLVDSIRTEMCHIRQASLSPQFVTLSEQDYKKLIILYADEHCLSDFTTVESDQCIRDFRQKDRVLPIEFEGLPIVIVSPSERYLVKMSPYDEFLYREDLERNIIY